MLISSFFLVKQTETADKANLKRSQTNPNPVTKTPTSQNFMIQWRVKQPHMFHQQKMSRVGILTGPFNQQHAVCMMTGNVQAQDRFASGQKK